MGDGRANGYLTHEPHHGPFVQKRSETAAKKLQENGGSKKKLKEKTGKVNALTNSSADGELL